MNWLAGAALVFMIAVGDLWGLGSLPGAAPSGAGKTHQPAVPRAEKPSLPESLQITVPAGTLIRVRLNQTLSTSSTRPGTGFTAALAEPLSAGGRVVAPLGALLQGVVTRVEAPGRFTGGGEMGLQLNRLINPDQTAQALTTAPGGRTGKPTLTRNLGLIAAGAVLGAGVGSMLGQTAGALIGIGVGGGTGGVFSWATGPTHLALHAGTELVFTLSRPVVFSFPPLPSSPPPR